MILSTANEISSFFFSFVFSFLSFPFYFFPSLLFLPVSPFRHAWRTNRYSCRPAKGITKNNEWAWCQDEKLGFARKNTKKEKDKSEIPSRCAPESTFYGRLDEMGYEQRRPSFFSTARERDYVPMSSKFDCSCGFSQVDTRIAPGYTTTLLYYYFFLFLEIFFKHILDDLATSRFSLRLSTLKLSFDIRSFNSKGTIWEVEGQIVRFTKRDLDYVDYFSYVCFVVFIVWLLVL